MSYACSGSGGWYVTAGGAGTWTRLRTGAAVAMTYTPTVGATLFNNKTNNIATFGGGLYSSSYSLTSGRNREEFAYEPSIREPPGRCLNVGFLSSGEAERRLARRDAAVEAHEAVGALVAGCRHERAARGMWRGCPRSRIGRRVGGRRLRADRRDQRAVWLDCLWPSPLLLD